MNRKITKIYYNDDFPLRLAYIILIKILYDKQNTK